MLSTCLLDHCRQNRICLVSGSQWHLHNYLNYIAAGMVLLVCKQVLRGLAGYRGERVVRSHISRANQIAAKQQWVWIAIPDFG